MQPQEHWGAPGRRPLLMAALLAVIAGCVPLAQVKRYQGMVPSAGGVASAMSVVPEEGETEIFAGDDFLSREGLITEVLRRNPTVEASRQAWREALSRYPRATALGDPRVAFETAPGTIGSKHGFGQVVRLTQRIEWPGKQALRGAIALAEAEARSADLERVRLHLAMTASLLFDEHYVVRRTLEINLEHVSLVSRLWQGADAQYASGRGSQQDPLQADVELALLERDRLKLLARQQTIAAQINGLLHRPPATPLPPAPATLGTAAQPDGEASEWAERAARERPELRTSGHRVQARERGLALAEQASRPDFVVGGTYNSMWPMTEHRFMVGVSLNIPIQLDAIQGAVHGAGAALARARAVHALEVEQVAVEVREAWVLLEEAIAQVAFYGDRLLPAARRQVAAAEAGYPSGRASFSDIMMAEGRLRSFEQEYEEALANTWRRRAALDRATGLAHQPPSDGGAP